MMPEIETGLEVSFTYCKNFASAETKSATWEEFARTVSTSKPYETKEQSIRRAAIIGGVRQDEVRGRADNVKSRTILTLDYDDFPEGVTLDDIAFAFEMALDCAFVAYSTFRHTPDAPRVRLMAPLSRTVSDGEYQAIVARVADDIGLEGLDKCSYTVNQIMFLASHKEGVEPWTMEAGDGALDVDSLGIDFGGIVRSGGDGEADDLSSFVAAEPLDLTEDQVTLILEKHDPSTLDYDEWLRTGMAIWHQTEGEGYDTWREWSKRSPKHDETHMRTKWRSFGGRDNPVTMASIIHAVGGLSGEAVSEGSVALTQTLEDAAMCVDSQESYRAFRKRVRGLNDIQMPRGDREYLASIVHEVYAGESGISLTAVKADMRPPKIKGGSQGASHVEGGDVPDWLDGWIYDEVNTSFVKLGHAGYSIRREAFRAKFDRLLDGEDSASFALNVVRIPSCRQGMYWPGQPDMFTHKGDSYYNSYVPHTQEICEELDEDGSSVVALFNQHLENTIADERERRILLDFMSYVYRNPGKRVRWGLLLWGIEGNGKTYFFNVMGRLLGHNSRAVTTSLIESQFNEWAEGVSLIGIEEIRIAGTNKWKILDQIKPLISNDEVSIHPKGKAAYQAPNFANYMMMTNHIDAIPVSDNDRRYAIIMTRQRSKEDLFRQHGGSAGVDAYFNRLFSETYRRIDAIGHFLMHRELSEEFNPESRAPVTSGIEKMRDANKSDDRLAVEFAMEDHACDVVGPEIVDVTYLEREVMLDDYSEPLPKGRAFANVMRDMGYEPISGRRVRLAKPARALHSVWVKGVDDELARERVRLFHAGDDGVVGDEHFTDDW